MKTENTAAASGHSFGSVKDVEGSLRTRMEKAIAIQPESLPVEDGWAELVVVTLAAHEIRMAAGALVPSCGADPL